MKDHHYLTFSLNNSLYGISTFSVKEIFYLPELTPIPEARRDIVGVVNVRGDILPVMDINIRLGYKSPDYRLTDSVVVLSSKELRVGIIVNEVHEVRNIASEEITTELSRGRELAVSERKKFIAGIARNAEDIFILLDPENLLRYVETQDVRLTEELLKIQDSYYPDQFHPNGTELLESQRVFSPNATPEERAIFRKRAENLRQSADGEDLAGFSPLAVVVLNDEFFGIDLKMVREFTNIRQATPIPCCPPHIIGNMNLRGEILTLVDIRGLLNLPLMDMADSSKAMIVQAEDIVAGIKVEEVFDVMFLHPQEIKSVPTAIHSVNDECLQGTAPYHGKMMSILDMPKILLNGGLIVDEAV
ncbi:MAG: chemotaxis protein CheW [Xenococcaceae cyanobacterium]